ncbi:MAG: FkbM family methyltransferase [Myxococcales bacterium]|nr:FkbM family methyltransferase [Myxococcales bacterium]HIM02316.1 FkbM family methyltransferase [Myxococcales bacterium]
MGHRPFSPFARPSFRALLLGGWFFASSIVACHSDESEPTAATHQSDRTGAVIDSVSTVEPAIPAEFGDFLKSNEKLYSQFNEELIVRHFFKDRRDGVFLDVGCAYPIRLSTTYFLEKHLDWSGIAIDAFDYYRKAWTKERKRSNFLNYAVGDQDGETITFHVAGEPSLSSVNEEQAEKWGGPESVALKVETITLTKALEDHADAPLDFLSIDIEGAELAALSGFDIDRFRPKLVCIEAHTNGGANEEGIRSYFGEHGYVLLEAYLPYDRANWYFAPRD